MIKKVLSVILAATMILVLFTGCVKSEVEKAPESKETKKETTSDAKTTENEPELVIKVSNGASQTSPQPRACIEKFKPLVEEMSNGRIKVEVYHSGQLGDDVKAMEALRAGTLEMCIPSTAPMVGFAKEMAIFDIPFLFTSEEQADAILDGPIGQKIEALLPANGLVSLGWLENGYRNVTNSSKEIKTPADLKGLKIRTMDNPIHLATWKLLGANPTPMSFSEVFTALQQKAIDGQENPIPLIYSQKFYEVNKYISMTGHVYSPMLILYSEKLFSKLSEEDQEILIKAGRETTLYERKINREATLENLESMKAEGAIVTNLTVEQKKAFQDLTAPVWDKVGEKVGDELIKELKDELAKLQ